MLNAFDLIRPHDINEALTAVVGGDATPIAGGTDLLVRMKKGMLSPEKVVDISGIKELKEIRENGDNIILGSLVTHAQVVNSEPANSYLPLLVQGCRTVGSPQIRNTGTLGGNIANASFSISSFFPYLIASAIFKNTCSIKSPLLLVDSLLKLGWKPTTAINRSSHLPLLLNNL
jgi:CO/xanthine dehydrogenase FAD-binding subunit